MGRRKKELPITNLKLYLYTAKDDDYFVKWGKPKLHYAPEKSGIYFLYNKRRKLIYIGISENIRKRLLQHLTCKTEYWHRWMGKQITYFEYDEMDIKQAYYFEGYLVRTLQPFFNTGYICGKRYFIEEDIKERERNKMGRYDLLRYCNLWEDKYYVEFLQRYKDFVPLKSHRPRFSDYNNYNVRIMY